MGVHLWHLRPARTVSHAARTIGDVYLHSDRWRPSGRPLSGNGRGPAVAVGLVTVLVLGYAVVAIVADVPGDGRSWPGQGFIALAAIALTGLVSLAATLRRSRRH